MPPPFTLTLTFAIPINVSVSVGDTVYTNTDDTPLGTVKSLGASEIVLNANLAAQVEDNEEIVNANPIRLIFHFEL